MTIETRSHLVGADEFNRTIKFVLVEDEEDGPGIALVRVIASGDDDGEYNVFKKDFSQQDEEPCPDRVEFTVEVAKTELPLRVEAIDCDDKKSPPTDIRVAPPGADELDPNLQLPCTPEFCPENVDCSEEQAALEEVRDEILKLCEKAQRLRDRRDNFAAAAATAFELARGFAATAASLSGTVFGNIAAAVFYALAAAALVIAVTLSAIAAAAQRRLNDVEDQIEDARDRFSDAASTVREECCTQCIFVDIDQPEC